MHAVHLVGVAALTKGVHRLGQQGAIAGGMGIVASGATVALEHQVLVLARVHRLVAAGTGLALP